MDHKETSSQLKLIKNNYVTILHQPVTVSWITCSQMHVCTNRAFSSKSIRFNHYIGWCYILLIYFIPVKVRITSCRCARECFICTCLWLHVFEPTATDWCIAITQLFLSGSSWLLVSLVCITIPTYRRVIKFNFHINSHMCALYCYHEPQ